MSTVQNHKLTKLLISKEALQTYFMPSLIFCPSTAIMTQGKNNLLYKYADDLTGCSLTPI